MKILSNSPGVLWDCHMHSEFSADSGTPTADMIRQAIALGFKGICFTEHLDPDYPPTPDDLEFALDIPAYYTKLNELKETYKNQIHIHFGIEIGLQLHLKQYFHNLLKEYPFRFRDWFFSRSPRCRPLLPGIFPGQGRGKGLS